MADQPPPKINFFADMEGNVREPEHEPIDDMEMPPDAVLDADKMMETVSHLNRFSVTDTPTTPRPGLPRNLPSGVAIGGRETDPNPSPDMETGDDPNGDELSMNTDINRHERAIDQHNSRIRAIEKKLDSIPELMTKISNLTSMIGELHDKYGTSAHEVTLLKQSFAQYQSAAANKIADIERRAAEKQLRVDAELPEEMIPPDVLSLNRPGLDPKTPQVSSIITAVAGVPAKAEKKKASMPDW